MALFSSARHRLATEIDLEAFEGVQSTIGTGSIALADSPDTAHARKQGVRIRAAAKTSGTSDEARLRYRPMLRETSEWTIKPGDGALDAFYFGFRASRSGAITSGTIHQVFEARNQADDTSRVRAYIDENGAFVLGVNNNSTTTSASTETVNDDEVFEAIVYYQPTSGASDGEARLYLVQSGSWVEVCTITGHDYGGIWFADWYSKIGPGGAADATYNYDLNLMEVAFSAVARSEVEEELPWDARCCVEFPTHESATVQVWVDPREYRNATHAQVRWSLLSEPGASSQTTEWVALNQTDTTDGAEVPPITRIELLNLPAGRELSLDIALGDGTGTVAMRSSVYRFRTLRTPGDLSPAVYGAGSCIDQYSGPQLGLQALAQEPVNVGKRLTWFAFQGDNGDYEGTIVNTRLGFDPKDTWAGVMGYHSAFRSDPGWLASRTAQAIVFQSDDHPFNNHHAGHADDTTLLSAIDSRWSSSSKTAAEFYASVNTYFDHTQRDGQPNRPHPDARYWSIVDGAVLHVFLDDRDGDQDNNKALSDAQMAWAKALIKGVPPTVRVALVYFQGSVHSVTAQTDSPATVAAAQIQELLNDWTANAPDWLRILLVQGDTHATILAVHTALPSGVTDSRGIIAGNVMACPMGTVLIANEPNWASISGDVVFRTEHGSAAASDDPQHGSLNGSVGGFAYGDLVRSSGAIITVDITRGVVEFDAWRIDKNGAHTHVNGGTPVSLSLNAPDAGGVVLSATGQPSTLDGSLGNLDVPVSTRSAFDPTVDLVTTDAGSRTASQADVSGLALQATLAGLNDVTADQVRDAILDRILTGNHDTAGTTGEVLQSIASGSIGTVDGLSMQRFYEIVLAYIAGQTVTTDNGDGTLSHAFKLQDGTTTTLTITTDSDGQHTDTVIA